MSTDTPRPGRVTLSDEEREALARSVAATINYHSFDAAAETADFDMADAILDTNLAATSAGLVMTVERILAAREQALREEIAGQGEIIARVRDLLEVLDNSDDGGRIVWASGLEAPVSDLRDGLRRALAVTEEWGETR